jgi:hypothetical protein
MMEPLERESNRSGARTPGRFGSGSDPAGRERRTAGDPLEAGSEWRPSSSWVISSALTAHERPRRAALGGLLKVSVAVVSTLIGALIAEGALRIFWAGYYMRAPRGHLEFHPTRGFANKPSVRVEYGKPEYRIMLGHNALGFRGREVSRSKAPEKVRIFALGDSMTYGLGVEDDETYSAILEKLDPRLEVINAGVAGYSPAEELLLLRERGLDLAPDIVTVMFIWNDLRDAYKESYTRVRLEEGALRFDPPKDGSLEHPILKPKRIRHPLLSRSYLYRFVSDRLKGLRYRLRPAQIQPLLPPEEIEPAWELVLALFREIATLANEDGARFLLIVAPDQVQVEPDVLVLGVDPTVFGMQKRIRTFGAAEGIAVLDLEPGFRDAYDRDGVRLHYRYDRHWTPAGHRAAAKLILEELERRGFVERAAARAEPGEAPRMPRSGEG